MNDKEIVNSAIEALCKLVKLSEKENECNYSSSAATTLKDLIRKSETKLTDEQKNCPYCHEPFKIIGNFDAGFRIDPNSRTIAYYDATGESFSDGYPFPEYQFNYCPMCSRKLGD